MVFRRETKYKNNSEARTWIYYHARRIILFYKFGAAEKQLDQYCRTNYSQPLKYVCLRLLNGCTISTDNKGTAITFLDENLNKLARLITYGNGKIYGSEILKAALC